MEDTLDGKMAWFYHRLRGIMFVQWKPNRDTVVALISYLLVIGGLIMAFQVFTTTRVAANFITFGPLTLAGLGVALPVWYTIVMRKRPLDRKSVV